MIKAQGDDRERRRYWIEVMERAARFMEEIRSYPVEECGESLGSLRDAVRDAGVEVEFAESKIGGIYDRQFYLRKGLLPAFLGAAGEMNGRGWMMRVEDAYRTMEIQRALARDRIVFDRVLQLLLWELKGATPTAQFMMRRLGALSATSPKTGTHMSGSALDISVRLLDGSAEVDRGGPYVELSVATPMDSPFISEQAGKNRIAITDIMNRWGFVAYPFEFWHYSQGDAYDYYLRGRMGEPAPYGPVSFDPDSGEIAPIENPKQPLHSDEEVEEAVRAILSRDNSLRRT
jgi:D-alanyl-D-alanine dipeptidase